MNIIMGEQHYYMLFADNFLIQMIFAYTYSKCTDVLYGQARAEGAVAERKRF